MFKVLLLATLAAVALAQHGGYGQYGRPYYDDYAQPIPYNFGYDFAGDYGESQQNRQESGDGHGNVQGSYGYRDAYGVYRQVDYVADAYGFRANVKTNEPGTANQNPADVSIHSDAPQYLQYQKY